MIDETMKSQSDSPRTGNVVDNDDRISQPRIVIVGCGGAGNNIVNRLYHMGYSGGETIAIDMDRQHLDMIQAGRKMLIGASLTKSLDDGSFPDVGKRAAEMARPMLEELFADADLCIITTGMGGCTGTTVAPIVARIAKEQGTTVIGIAGKPLKVEIRRLLRAEEGLGALSAAADTVIVLDNNRLAEFVPNVPYGQVFSVMDQLIAETVRRISETITDSSLTSIDEVDILKILDTDGIAIMLLDEMEAESAVQK